MAKIVRYNGNLQAFASAAIGTERTLFGEVAQANDLTSQFTAEFLRGWGIVGPSDQPTLEDFNAAMYTNGQLSAYLHQMGVAEYNAAQEYHIGSLCNVAGVIYVSLINTNVGNTPTSSPAQWRELYAQATETVRGTGQVATQAIAEAGVSDVTLMTPLKTKQAIAATPVLSGISGVASNLRMSAVGTNAVVTISADEICVKNSAGSQKVLQNVSIASLNLAASGLNGLDTASLAANTWYACYVIWNPATNTVGSVASTSYTAPSLPAGYTHWAFVGSVRCGATNTRVLPFIRRGNKTFYVPTAGTDIPSDFPVILNAGTSSSFVQLSLQSYIPPSAVLGRLAGTHSGTVAGFIAFTMGSGGSSTGMLAQIFTNGTGIQRVQFDVPDPYNRGVWYAIGNNGTGTLLCLGFEE